MEKAFFDFDKKSGELARQDAINKIYDHPQFVESLYKIGMNDESIKKYASCLLQYSQDRVYCKNCPGLEECEKTNPHLTTKLSYKNNHLIQDLQPCKLLIKEMALEKSFKVHDFPSDYFKASIKTLDKNNKRLSAVIKLSNFITQNEFSWIYLKGSNKSGKSYLAATLSLEYIRKKKGSACFIDTPSRTSECNLHFYKNKDAYLDDIYLYSTCDVLVFDNFGDELKSDVVRDDVILTILSNRNDNKLLTIFVSSYDISDIVDMYNKSRYAKEKALQIGKLISSNAGKEINLGSLPIYK